jgi:putative flavoprotein involved in K+ transport
MELGVLVERILPIHHGWLVQTNEGLRRAHAVVVATGLNARPDLPAWAVDNEWVTTATAYRDATPYRDRDVVVVGGGSTAHDIALDLVRGRAARVRLAMRTPPLLAPRSIFGISSAVLSLMVKHGPTLPPWVHDRLSLALHRLCFPDADRLLGRPPAGMSTTLRERGHGLTVDTGILEAVRRGDVEVIPAVVALDNNELTLADGKRLRPDAVLVATGRRPRLEPMLGNMGVLGADGRPLVHGAETMPHAPDLYFVGFRLPAGQLPDLRFDASAIAKKVAASLTVTRAA